MTRGAILAAALAITTAGCGTAHAAAPPGHTITGTVTALNATTSPAAAGTPCVMHAGYSDLPGATVTITDQHHTVIATASLDQGTPSTTADTCRFAFAVHVPDRPFYEIAVANRGTVTYSAAQLAAAHWSPTLTIGS